MSVETPGGVELVSVVSAKEMQQAMTHAAKRADVVIMAAAVADYRPVQARARKLRRVEGRATLALESTPDILAGLGAARRPKQTLIGFALETASGLGRARAKLASKSLDLVVLNTAADGLGGDTNRVTLVERRTQRKLPLLSKREVADALLERVLELRRAVPGPKRRGA
jgi:phosphopantothenoylcysteine decarboxylase/phosphopantothenate--cysteine ligase